MPVLLSQATRVAAHGNQPKQIEEYIGRLNSGDTRLSIAHMHSPPGWAEPGQRPEFDEYTVVLNGCLRVESASAIFDVRAGQAIAVSAGEWIRYSSPEAAGAEYIAVCLPAFSADTVHRDPDAQRQ